MTKSLHIAYDHGPQNSPSATVILLHGIASSSITWERVLEGFERTDVRVVAIDLLGFGGSPKPLDEGYDVTGHAEWVEHTLAGLSIDHSKPVILVGHSMGSLITAHIAARNRDSVSEIVLVSPPVLLPPESTPEGQSVRATDLFSKAYRYLKTHKDFTLEHSEKVRKTIKLPEAFEITEESWVPFRKSLERTIENQRLIQDLMKFDKQVNVLYGSLDGLIITDNVRSLRILPNVHVTKATIASHAVRGQLATITIEALHKAVDRKNTLLGAKQQP